MFVGFVGFVGVTLMLVLFGDGGLFGWDEFRLRQQRSISASVVFSSSELFRTTSLLVLF